MPLRLVAGLMTASLLLLLASACGKAEPTAADANLELPDAGAGVPSDAGTEPDVDLTPDASVEADAGSTADASEPLCGKNTLELLTVNYGDTERYYVEATWRGEQVALQLDTGSALTFIFQGPAAPSYTPQLGFVELGCETVPIAGRNLSAFAETVGDGLPVVGLLGMDYLLGKPSLFDAAGRSVTRFARFPSELIDAQTRFVPFDNVLDHALVPCQVDGAAVRLMFDTGGGHSLRVGVSGQPGDQVEYVQDAAGNVFPIYVGSGLLAFPGLEPRQVPLARAPTFPYFQQTVDALGGNLHGLLGVSAFPDERLLVSAAERRIYLLPR